MTALDVVGVYGEDEAFEDETYFRDDVGEPDESAASDGQGAQETADDADTAD